MLQVVTQLERAGAQSLAAWLETSGAAGELHTIFLYDKSGSDLFPSDRALLAARPSSIRDVLRMVGLLRRAMMRAPGPVVAHTHFSIVLCGLIALTFGGRVVAVHHWPVSRYPWTARAGLTLCRVFHVIAADVTVAPALGVAKSTFIPNPVPDVRVDAVLEERTPSPDLLLVARHAEEKDIPTAIRSLRFLSADRALTLVGRGELTEQLLSLARSEGVDDRVHFAGALPHDVVMAMMKKCRCLLLTSRWEAMPMSLLEGVAVGSPIVVSDISAHAFVIKDGAALSFVAGSAEDLAQRVEEASSLDALDAMREGRFLLRTKQSSVAVGRLWSALLASVR